VGAKLGAILCGFPWTAVDAYGLESLSFKACADSRRRLWTRLGELRIRRLGVELAEFAESLRACCETPARAGVSVIFRRCRFPVVSRRAAAGPRGFESGCLPVVR